MVRYKHSNRMFSCICLPLYSLFSHIFTVRDYGNSEVNEKKKKMVHLSSHMVKSAS